MTQERFEYLFGLYKTGSLPKEEWDELREAIRRGQHDAWLQKDFENLLQQEGIHETWTPQLEAAMWQQIRRGRSRHWLPYAAAAGLLACIVMAWLFKSGPAHHSPQIAATGDIRPGTNKAILTLANGTQIFLDSLQNGRIARQGATTVIKLNGIISYSGDPRQGANEEAPLYNTITTPRGGQYELVLPDGSRVWLNSASSLRFPTAFRTMQREVELTGEGYFEIEKDAGRPFTVWVDHMKVQVLGTSFNTMAYPDESTINTTLVDGAVVISGVGLQKKLQPGQQAVFDSASRQLSVRKTDVRLAIAWKTGLFEFDNTDLETILRQLARWYDIEIVYRVRPEKTPLGGNISRNLQLKEVLDLLEANGINHFKIEGKKVFVLP
jgi:ferric-dicitrate binding protein FerR (iron transport regulator)